MKSGANLLTKPVSNEQLLHVLSASWNGADALTCKDELNLEASAWTRKIEPLLERIATSEAPILLQGETGVGKEVLARRIHRQSLRSGEVFLKLNCAALPSELVESELFGYERGSFTGAFRNTPGKFELANRGTILLDEIGDMDLKLQAKLLQVLQDGEFLRLGAKQATQVDVRVMAASHRDLEERVEEGTFREDLYYRLNVLNIVIPPLRDRLNEIIPLASLFLRKHAPADTPIPEIGQNLRAALLAYRWPGNVRELENIVRRYLVVRDSAVIIEELARRMARQNRCELECATEDHPRSSDTSALPLFTLGEPKMPRPNAQSTQHALAEFPLSTVDTDDRQDSELTKLDQVRREAEIEVIMKTLHSTQWNRKRAAALLGTEYKALLYKMKKLGIR